MDPKYYIKVLLKRKYLIAIICLISGASTFVLLSYKNKEYISRAQLATGITDNEEVSVTQTETNWNSINNKFNNFIEFMGSKEIYSLLMYQLLLHDLQSDTPFRPIEINKIKARLSPSQVKKVEQILQMKYDSMQVLFTNRKAESIISGLIREMNYDIKSIKKILAFSRIPNTDYIKLECKSENPELSAFIVNKYTEETIRFYKNRELVRIKSSVALFEELANKKKEALDQKSNILESFKESSQLIDYKIQSGSKLDQIASLEQARNDESKKILSLQNAIEQANFKLNGAGVDESYNSKSLNNTISSLQAKISALNRRHVLAGMKDPLIVDSLNILKEKLDIISP